MANIKLATEGGVATLTLARADKKNALNQVMYRQLADHLTWAATASEVRVVLIQGEGGDFCAGNDMAEFAAAANEGAGLGEATHFLTAIATFPKPLVAAVRGVAVGVGTTMLPHCDLVYVAEDARLAVPFGSLGLTPEAGSSRLLPPLIGHPKAFAMFTLGETLSGAAAAAAGLANRAAPAKQVDALALADCKRLAGLSQEALIATKRLMRRTPELLEHMAVEITEIEARIPSQEARSAFARFLGKS